MDTVCVPLIATVTSVLSTAELNPVVFDPIATPFNETDPIPDINLFAVIFPEALIVEHEIDPHVRELVPAAILLLDVIPDTVIEFLPNEIPPQL
jgi:hypothetical protein